jgi:hypothetical protein
MLDIERQAAERRIAYRIRDLVPILGWSELAIRREIERGTIPARRWGRRIVILRDELETFLQQLPKCGDLD